MQIIEVSKIPFRNTVHAAGLRCMVCNFHPAEIRIRAQHGPAKLNFVVCPKCAALGEATLESILFPLDGPERETVPAMAAGY